MVQTVKNNPTPLITTAVVTPADMLKRTVQLGKAVHTAALDFVYASAAYILLVNHFKTAKDEGYLSRTAAREYLEKQLQEGMGIGARMIYKYLAPADVLVVALTGKTLYASTLDRLGKAEKPEDMTKIIASWVESVKGKKMASLTDLHEALGFSTPKTAKAKPMNAERGLTQLENTVEKVVDIKGVKSSTLAQAIVPKVENKSAFIIEAIKQIAEVSDLKAIEEAIKEQAKFLRSVSTNLKAAAKKAVAETTTKSAGRKPPQGRGRAQHLNA